MPSNFDDRSARARERILAAASQVFAQHGFTGGSLNDIAQLAGLTRAGVLHHYANKEAVLVALLARRDEELRIFDDSDASHGEGGLNDLFESILQLMPQVLADRQAVEFAHTITAEASYDAHPAHAWVRDRHLRVRESFALQVARAKGRGEVRADCDPTLLATAILGVIEGVEAQWLVSEGEIDPLAALSLAFHGLELAVASHLPTI